MASQTSSLEATGQEATDQEVTVPNEHDAHSEDTSAQVDAIKVIQQPNCRFLVNRSSFAIRRMWLTDRVISYRGEVEFPSPIHEIRNLSAQSYMQLPGWDDYQDGRPIGTLTDVEWEDGTSLSKPTYRGKHKKWDGTDFDEQFVEGEAELIACTLDRQFEPLE